MYELKIGMYELKMKEQMHKLKMKKVTNIPTKHWSKYYGKSNGQNCQLSQIFLVIFNQSQILDLVILYI